MAGPLQGIRVVELAQMIAGPLAAMHLGDQGADVIKVEPPGSGDPVRGLSSGVSGVSALFATANRNKRSVVLDLKQEAGVAALLRLVEQADVFLQNFRPGAVERMGLAEPTVRAHRPDILYVSISGFGEKGPYAHKRVYDPVIQALSGLTSIQGDRVTGRPRMVRTILPDLLTAMTAAQAISSALVGRERTGQGQHLRLAMLDTMVSFLWPEGMTRYTFPRPEGEEERPRTPQVRDLIFETRDGYMTSGAVVDREWNALSRAVGHPEWIEDERFRTVSGRIFHWDARLELMQEVFETKTTAEWLEILDAADVPCAPVNRRADLLTDPQIAANQLIVEDVHPHVGPIRQTRPAARFDATPAEIARQAPILGEHTDEVLRESGFTAAELEALRRSGVLG